MQDIYEKMVNYIKTYDIDGWEKIVDLLDVNENDAVYIYSSHMEGLGTLSSDIDIYAFSAKFEDKVCIYLLNGLNVDVEYLNTMTFFNKIKTFSSNYSINNRDFNMGFLKLLLRLKNSLVPFENNLVKEMYSALEKIDLKRIVIELYCLNARSYYDDAVKMYENNEFILAIDAGRRALWEAIGAYNAYHGKLNCKYKWISKIFLDNEAFGNSYLLNEYLDIQIYPNITTGSLEDAAEKILSLVQEVIIMVSL